MAEYIVAIDVTRVRFPADAWDATNSPVRSLVAVVAPLAISGVRWLRYVIAHGALAAPVFTVLGSLMGWP